LRAYLRADAAGIAREHRLIQHAALRGVPAIAPISCTGGATTLEHVGLHYALFPKARGQQHQRAELTPVEAAAMGRCLAELHLALADAPPRLARTRIHPLNREHTLAAITRLLEQAADEALLVRHLQGQRTYLQSSDTAPVNLSGLPHQIIHGDFTESNLFFEHNMVSAVIDWENSYVAPRAWEVARTIHLAFHFAPALCVAFVAGYRSLCGLTLSELDLAARAYAQMRDHDLWMIEAVLVRGDPRPRRFLHPSGFQPVLPHWIELRLCLNL
jgi:homoserine kinase type II